MGKGDAPRNCFSKQFKQNYNKINWKSNDKKLVGKTKVNNKASTN
jgi:hypothetical protein